MGFSSLFSKQNQRVFFNYISPLCSSEQVKRLRNFRHHRNITRYEHVLLVSYLSFALARRWHWDSRAAARAGLLHDLFWVECDNSWQLCMHHPEMAVINAEQLIGDLSPKERNIILSHMWPAGKYLPRCREAWLVDIVDDLVAVLDFMNISYRWNRRVAALMPA